MIGIIETGISNTISVTSALSRLGLKYKVLEDNLDECDRYILPGVGNFSLLKSRLTPKIKEQLKSTIKPVLGICLGMQFLFARSEEGEGGGLGIIESNILKLPIKTLPHMGWNEVNIECDDPLLKGIESGDDFYFVHTFGYLNSEYALTSTTVEDIKFSSMVKKENFYGVQFHPEKSARLGERLLLNFSELI